MDERINEVKEVTGDCLKEILKNNNTYFYQKGWDRGFLLGTTLTGAFLGTALITVCGTYAILDVMKGVKKNGSKPV